MKFLKMSLLTINIIFMVTFIVFFPLNITLADERKVSLNDPLGLSGNEKALQIIIGRVINASLGIVGSLALLMFVYSGLLLITSAGNQVVRRDIKTQTTEINNVIKTQPQIMIVN